jgi:hypothetical protein
LPKCENSATSVSTRIAADFSGILSMAKTAYFVIAGQSLADA